ncbi:MAG: DUF2851 family protein [Bacteroidales bacterium]|nr:DUF2851 family protein [Bacteroidales bacterium]
MEDLLHYIWKNRQYNAFNLKTTEQQDLKIIHPGFWNRNAGPDFSQAIIKIDDITWVGNVEIHNKSSDWFRHHHENDQKYNSVILHVVYEHDKEIPRNESEHIPTLELKNLISEGALSTYRTLSTSAQAIACGFAIKEIDSEQLSQVLTQINLSRIIRKHRTILNELSQCDGDWEELTYRMLAINFGFKINAPAFEQLSHSIKFKTIEKHHQSQTQTYALLFGQAGLLEDNDIADKYYEALQSEYYYLKYKYSLVSIAPSQWNKLRLRPSNFPCLRLAQFSEILHHLPHLFQTIISEDERLKPTDFQNCIPHEYWRTHYEFGKEVERHNQRLGDCAVNLIYINTILPIMYTYGIFSGKNQITEKAVWMLKELPFENNSLTRPFKGCGFPHENAEQSQAILELRQKYCYEKKCLFCPIGKGLLQKVPL